MPSTATVRAHGNAYEIFILVLTILSLAVMVLLLLPLSPATIEALLFFDNLICFVFLADFLYNLSGSNPDPSTSSIVVAGSTSSVRSRAWGSSRSPAFSDSPDSRDWPESCDCSADSAVASWFPMSSAIEASTRCSSRSRS